jgi:hypothetical protein
MQWLRRNRKPLALLGAGAVAMVVLVTIILVKREDRGFMIRECVKGQSSKGFTKWGYSDLPVPVVLDALAAEWLSVTATAAKKWNDAAGKALLGEPRSGDAHDRSKCSEPGKPGDPVILITRLNSDGAASAADEKLGVVEAPGHAHLYYDSACRIRCVEIGLPGLADKSKWEKITTHELGHALGLDHDDFEDSIMYFGGRAMGWGLDTITEEDKKLLSSAYR